MNTVYKVGREKQLDPLLLLAVIAIESRYNPLAESHVGAQGLMRSDSARYWCTPWAMFLNRLATDASGCFLYTSRCV